MNCEKFHYLRWFGVITLGVYWALTLVSIMYNPSFSIFKNALSDLGATNANFPWIYNSALIFSAPFFFLFSLYLLCAATNKLQVIGASFLVISSLFLAFIGIFHSGTRPHGFVSTYFFFQSFLGILVWGMGSRKTMKLGISLFLFALGGAFLPWPSTAILEIYEIFLIAIFAFFVPFQIMKITL